MLVSICSAFGQGPAGQFGGGGMGYFALGGQTMAVRELRDRLQQAGYGRLPEQGVFVGGGGVGWIGRFCIGGE
ncbi:MAG: hypothetical protein NZ949_07655, partial [Candidatus Kapabacteria bacterium]|nr:hypothetical protein [Candidatus Kapabacteria bacterium]